MKEISLKYLRLLVRLGAMKERFGLLDIASISVYSEKMTGTGKRFKSGLQESAPSTTRLDDRSR